MPPKRPLKRRGDDDDRSPARLPKKAGKNKREQTYDTYDEALDGGVEMEEKGERYRDGDKAQRFYERAVELYGKAFEFSQTYDAAYNQARALYTLSTQFLLPPESLEKLHKSVELYRLATTLTNSPLLRMEVGFNLSQACSSLGDLVEDLEGDEKADDVRTSRVEARDVLQDVMDGQEEYLRATAEQDRVETEETVDQIEGGAEGEGMDVDADADADPDVETAEREEGEGNDDDAASATFETHLPTPSTFIDTVLALLDLHLSLWESVAPSQTPTEAEQTAVRLILDRAASLAPTGRQAELDLAEIKVLLTMDSLVWDIFKVQAEPNMGLEKSLEGALAALTAVLASLEVTPPEEQTVRLEILTTLAETHMAIASKMMFLNPKLPPGPSPLAQSAWFHLSQAITHLTTALDAPTSPLTPKEFKPSVLLSLSKASLARARLARVNDTAKRNVVQLFENAATYAARSAEGLGWKFLRLDQQPSSILSGDSSLPYQAGWEAEVLARSASLQQVRTCLYASRTDLLPEESQGKYAAGLERIWAKATKGLKERSLAAKDVQRWSGEIEDDEGVITEEEKDWWTTLIA